MYVTNMHAVLLEEDVENASNLRMGYLDNYIDGSLTNMGIGRE